MKIIVYSVQDFERSYLLQANRQHHELTLLEEALDDGVKYNTIHSEVSIKL